MTQKQLKLPHEGRARYPLPNSHAVIIDLDDEHVVIEIADAYLHEVPELMAGDSFALGAGNLRFFYYRKTPGVSQFINSLKTGARTR